MLYQIENPVQGLVIKRPSLHCKTPYVADIILEDANGKQIMGHSPSLVVVVWLIKRLQLYYLI